MLTADQYRNSWYTLTRPDFEGPIRASVGFDRTTAVEVCRGLHAQDQFCVVGFGFPHDLIGDD